MKSRNSFPYSRVAVALLSVTVVAAQTAKPRREPDVPFVPSTEAAVQAMLEAMELGPWADSTPGALGPNWHKRVGLARALMLKPEVLLMDNPLAGLDLRHAYWWLGLLERLAKPHNFVRPEPLTLVVTTAELQPWIDLGQQFAILKDHRLTVLGARAQLQSVNQELIAELLVPKPSNG